MTDDQQINPDLLRHIRGTFQELYYWDMCVVSGRAMRILLEAYAEQERRRMERTANAPPFTWGGGATVANPIQPPTEETP